VSAGLIDLFDNCRLVEVTVARHMQEKILSREVAEWCQGSKAQGKALGLHGTASFTVLLKRTALTGEKRHLLLDPDTPCFLPPLPQKISF
jgi:hypothetical protein